jgi:hypothetical protein
MGNMVMEGLKWAGYENVNCGPPQKQGVCHIVTLPFTLKSI